MSDANGSLLVSTAIAIVATALVLLLAWFSIRWLSRMNRFGTPSENRLRIVQSVAVGSRERVVTLRDERCEYLIGVTPGGITLLERREI